MAVCFIGHRNVDSKDVLYPCLLAVLEDLILAGHTVFYLGSRSEFNSMAVSVLKELKAKYPQIHRIYVRAEYPHINEDYHAFLLESCDETYYPEQLHLAGRSVYVERNQYIIDRSSVCVFYYDEEQSNSRKKSGTRIAYEYAIRSQKEIVNLFA